MPDATVPAAVRADACPSSEGQIARVQVLSPVTIVVPTFREADNIPSVIARVEQLRESAGMEIELLFMDDDSRDGSDAIVRGCGKPWVKIVVRTQNRGLSPSVIDGLRLASHPVVVCMDADLSHPPEEIPNMLLALQSGQQLVLGSRYVPGGSTDDDWGIFRYLNSRIATLLARPLTSARDPMSGFFAMRKSDFDRARDLNPIGYKIALELIVKCDIENVGEVPIHFADRVRGQSKLSLKEQLRYVHHLRRLYIHKFGNAMGLLQFLAIGASGVVVNLSVLTLLMAMGAQNSIALAGGIVVSLLSNFALNRRFAFSYARRGNPWKQLAGFIGASMVGMLVNYFVSMAMLETALHGVAGGVQLAAMAGIAAGMIFNFAGNRFLVFRRRHVGDVARIPPAE